MRKIFIVGIGAGDPNHMTIQAINALNQVDVFFIPDKGAEKSDLHRLREEICERFIQEKTYRWVDFEPPRRTASDSGYLADVDTWHARLASAYTAMLTEHLLDDDVGAFLVWGDPGLYDSTLRILDVVRAKGFSMDYEVIPGISSVQALAAKHRIPLNRIGEPVLITTGRKLAQGFPGDVGSVVVMLDGEQAFKNVEPADLDIYWGAYLGTEDEILVAGKLSEVKDDIDTIRRQARRRKGWIMDTYLLRRSERE